MKLLLSLVSVSILLNAYVLWRLDEPSRIVATTYVAKSRPQATTTSASEDARNRGVIISLQTQITELGARIKAMEESEKTPTVDNEKSLDVSGIYTGENEVFEPFHRASSSASEEEWFWAGGGEEEPSLSFSQTDGFSVHSVVCRSDWCRVELEDASSEGSDLVDDLELQLKIDESLGRDTVMRSGERDGRHRVLFIR